MKLHNESALMQISQRFSGPLTCSFSKGVLKPRFFESGLIIKSFTVCNFAKTIAMKIFVFFKIFKIAHRFKKWNKKLRKSFLLL